MIVIVTTNCEPLYHVSLHRSLSSLPFDPASLSHPLSLHIHLTLHLSPILSLFTSIWPSLSVSVSVSVYGAGRPGPHRGQMCQLSTMQPHYRHTHTHTQTHTHTHTHTPTHTHAHTHTHTHTHKHTKSCTQPGTLSHTRTLFIYKLDDIAKSVNLLIILFNVKPNPCVCVFVSVYVLSKHVCVYMCVCEYVCVCERECFKRVVKEIYQKPASCDRRFT